MRRKCVAHANLLVIVVAVVTVVLTIMIPAIVKQRERNKDQED